MEREVIFSAEIEIYFKNLIDILYEKNYLGFKDDAKSYVQEIVLFVMNNDLKINVSKTPNKLDKFGSKLIKYKANTRLLGIYFSIRKTISF